MASLPCRPDVLSIRPSRTVASRARALLAGALAVGLVLAAGPAAGQDGAPPPSTPFAVTSNLPAADTPVPRDWAVELTFSRPLRRPAERIAVFIDRTDVTALFTGDGRRLAYERGTVLLPRGRHELVVHLVDAASGGWTEVARMPFQTPGLLGFHPGKTDAALTAAWAHPVADGHRPASGAPPDPPQNVDLQFRLTTEHVREGLTLASQTAVVGVTVREKALRYRDLQGSAPLVDLSSYGVQASAGPVGVSLGHVTAGAQRHLLNRFGSRGATVSLRPSSRVELAVAALGGSALVGWDDLLGVADGGHRIVTGSVGVEALPTPGALRLELTGMSGAVRPRPGVNDARVDDSEESRGLAVRVGTVAFDRRLRMEGGFAASAFGNPVDPALAQGQELVAVREETSGARYLEASVDALRGRPAGAGRSIGLTVGVRHERVDPLYRTLGAHVPADRLQDQIDLRADVAGVSVQMNHLAARNNLGDVASLLTTRTGRSQLSVGLPLGRMIASAGGWLPSLQYRADRTRQRGDGVPVGGGFSPSHVPDQVSLNETVQADWQRRRITAGLVWNRSKQDNRQPGREAADLTVTRTSATVRLAPRTSLTLGMELGWESSRNLERGETDETARWAFQFQWSPLDRSSLSVRLTDTVTEDPDLTRRRSQGQADVQWSSALPGASPVVGQYFLRFSRSRAGAFNALTEQDDERRSWRLESGLNLTFF